MQALACYLSGVSGISQTSKPPLEIRRATTTSSYYFAGVSGTSQTSICSPICFSSMTSSSFESAASILLLTPLPMPTLPELPTSRRCLYGVFGTLRGVPGAIERLGLPIAAGVIELRRAFAAGDWGFCGAGGAANGIGPVALKTGRALGFAALGGFAGDTSTPGGLSGTGCIVSGGTSSVGTASVCNGIC